MVIFVGGAKENNQLPWQLLLILPYRLVFGKSYPSLVEPNYIMPSSTLSYLFIYFFPYAFDWGQAYSVFRRFGLDSNQLFCFGSLR